MSGDVGDRLIFEAEWFDTVAGFTKRFYLYYYPADNTIELFDIRSRKTFLRRTKCEGVGLKDLYVGTVVTIFSRPMKITDVADSFTKSKLGVTIQKTFALLKPDVICKMGEILKIITAHDLHIADIKMVKLTEYDVEKLYKNDEHFDSIKSYLTSGPVVLLTLLGNNAVARWRELIGPTDSIKARGDASNSLRALYGKDAIFNGFYGSSSPEQAEKEVEMFFTSAKSEKCPLKNTATMRNCTCCIIKPHAVQGRLTGDIVCDIQKAGFTISAIQRFHVDPINAEEFLEIYKGVLSDHGAMVAELQSGPCISMEITHKDENVNVPLEFRKICGPIDPDIGRQVRPNTLRAKYGKSKVQNAVHCSDLPDDGLLEVEYFFKILDDGSS
ncbi:nucleoside diphosphate kinase 7 [Fopius arisanus]|uniref:NME7 protein n=1 Tax=Fopius arisanus TaxID=64838 RepID=A0A0C9QCH4_9HYME|nr:PREDICTED: nucleoside diphosphate kinase 7 [Fopius arisanus]